MPQVVSMLLTEHHTCTLRASQKPGLWADVQEYWQALLPSLVCPNA